LSVLTVAFDGETMRWHFFCVGGRRGVFCLPLALMEMETSHYGDKYKSWPSGVEREVIFFLWMVLVFEAN
jgi:hypothetical protein